MRSRANIGKSLDMSQEKRREIFLGWIRNEETQQYSQADIARQHDILPTNFHSMKKSKWFNEMKEEHYETQNS